MVSTPTHVVYRELRHAAVHSRILDSRLELRETAWLRGQGRVAWHPGIRRTRPCPVHRPLLVMGLVVASVLGLALWILSPPPVPLPLVTATPVERVSTQELRIISPSHDTHPRVLTWGPPVTGTSAEIIFGTTPPSELALTGTGVISATTPPR
jgi:hypothetical protein